MKRKTEKVYFDEQWEQMTIRLKAFIKTGDQEELHQFRVQVKKLRAMLVLLDATSSKNKLSKDFKPVRKIFKHCGDIRNAYINLQYGARYHFENERFITSQLDEIERGTNEVKELGRKYLKTIKTAHDDIGDELKPVDNSNVVDFYKTNLDQIALIIADLQFNEELHQARRQIKTLLYNRKIAQKALDGKLQISNEYMDKLQGLLGDWHDNLLALELFSSPEMNYKPIITKIKRQDARLKRSIAALTHDFMKKAVLTESVSEPQQ